MTKLLSPKNRNTEGLYIRFLPLEMKEYPEVNQFSSRYEPLQREQTVTHGVCTDKSNEDEESAVSIVR